MSHFLKVASASSATLALIAGTAMTSAYAVGETPAPAETTPAPVQVTPAPVETTPAPVETTPAPVETTPAPVETTPAPVETTPAPAETTPTAEDLIPAIGTKITLDDGVLFLTSAAPVLNEDGSNTGLATVPNSAFDGSFAVVDNADTLKIGDEVKVKLDYTNAVGVDQIKAVWDSSADATMLGTWSSSDTNVVSVDGGLVAKAAGAGTATLTFTPVFVKDGVVVEAERTFTVTVTVPGDAAETPAPAETTPAPAETTEAPAPAVEATSDPAAVVPAAAETPFVYENCAAVYAANAAPIHEGDYGWDASLDADGDKVGCEDVPNYVNDSSVDQTATYADGTQPELAETGAEAAVPFVAGLSLLALGTGAVVYSRRRTN